MGIFDTVKEPVFLKEGSNSEQQLAVLNELLSKSTGNTKELIENDIRCLRYGIEGENQIAFELKNSHMPMWIIHDLFVEKDGLSAQIDYFIITKHCNYVVECKNLYGNIEINNRGEFIRNVEYNGKFRKEGIYSPVTQNQRHLDLLKSILGERKKNILTKALFEKYFTMNYRGVVVLANPKTVLNAKFAKKEVKNQIVRVDGLISFIKRCDEENQKEFGNGSEKQASEFAEYVASLDKGSPADYAKKYRDLIETDIQKTAKTTAANKEDHLPVCSKCGAPMIKRTAKSGVNAGKEFYGCSRFPKCKGILSITQM